MASFFGNDPSRAGFFDRPGTTEMMMALGAGLAQAAYPAAGQSGWSQAPNAVLGALQARQLGAQSHMQDALFKQKMLEAEQERQAKAKLAMALSTPKPWTNPDTGQASTYGGPLAGIDPQKREMASFLAETDPKAAVSLLAQPEAFHSPVQALDPTTGKGRFVSPQTAVSGGMAPYEKPPEPSPVAKALRDAGIDPNSERGRQLTTQYAERLGAPPSTTVNMPPAEKKYEQTVGEEYGKAQIELQKAGRASLADDNRLDRLDFLLDKVDTGAFGETIVDAKKVAKAMGIDVGSVGDAEAGRTIANQMALELRNPAGGAGMPGAMSDKDREFLISMTPSLSTTKEGRKQIIETRKKLNQRSRDVAKQARQYESKHGKLDAGFDSELAAWADANPLFPRSAPETPSAGKPRIVDW